MPLRGEHDYALRSRLEISRILSKLAATYRLIVSFQMLVKSSIVLIMNNLLLFSVLGRELVEYSILMP